MAKYQFDGIAKFNATVIFTAMAASPLAFLTTGLLGRFTFFALTKLGNVIANKGLIIANVGVDYVLTLNQKGNFDSIIEDALKEVKDKKGRLTDAEKKAIDDKVIASFKLFISLI